MAPLTVTCPTGHPNCKVVSYPLLSNDVFWQNRDYHIAVGGPGPGTLNQQNLVSLYNGSTATLAPSQTTTGACTAANYWDIGVRGDTGPGNHNSTITLAPSFSVLTSASENGLGTNDQNSNPNVVRQYCNGSRIIPEAGTAGAGWQVPPGIADATVPNPIFNLAPTATVDEGNNWVNISWGPLTMSNPATATSTTSTQLGNYSITAGPAVDNGTATGAPTTDFFGNPRPSGPGFDIGAVELPGAPSATASVTGGPLAFGNVATGTTSAARTLTLNNTGTGPLTGITVVITAPFSRPAGAAGGNCTGTLAPASICMINVVFSPTALVTSTGTATITGSVTVAGSPVTLTGTGVAPVVSGVLAPPTRNFGTVTRGSLTGPVQVFTLTNNSNVPLTGITQGALGGANPTEFFIIRVLSTCGPAGNGQLLGQTTLAPGAACVVSVQFRPAAAPGGPLGAQAASVSVTDAAGTQTATLTGTAN
jgi:hypothetical protein